MTKRDQRRFVSDLLRSIRHDINAAINQDLIPRSWDGIELREYIAEKPSAPEHIGCSWDHGRSPTATTSRSRRPYESGDDHGRCRTTIA